MQLTERQVGHVTILDLVGRLTFHEDAERLKDKVNSLIQQQRTAILLNLAEISYMDSGGLGQLVASYSSVTRSGGALKLLHVNDRNNDLLTITRLVTVFQTFDSETEAVESFERPPVSAQSV